MNRIILIGNGFDLAHGLKTSYKDFIDDYWERFMNHCIYQDRINISGRYKYHCIELIIPEEDLALSNFLTDTEYPYLPPYKEKITYKELVKIIYDYNQININQKIQFKINNKFLLHLFAKCNKELAWVDIENEYYKFLSYYLNPTEFKYNYGTIDTLNNDFDVIKAELEIYLESVISNSNISAYKLIKNTIYSSFKLKDMVEKARMKIVLQESEKIKQYFDKDVNPDDYKISKKTIPWVEQYRIQYQYENFDLMDYLPDEKIENKYLDLKPDSILFLNFNYTNLEKLYCKHKDFKSEVIHIHGELKNKDNPMIFGYGDELEENYHTLENLKDNAYLENIKSIQYLAADNYKKLLNFVQSDEFQIIILGHSCGNSDRTLLNTLFEHENCVSIKPYYYRYKDKETREIKDNYSDIVRNISRSFTDKKSMRDKVVNKTYTTWFSEEIDV